MLRLHLILAFFLKVVHKFDSPTQLDVGLKDLRPLDNGKSEKWGALCTNSLDL